MTSHLSICILKGEVPFDGSLLGVSGVLPSTNFGLQSLSTSHASIQALSAEDANFNLGHVQPACVLGRVVELHAAQELGGRARSNHIVEAHSKLGVQVVQNQVNSACFGIGASEKLIDKGDEINFSAMGSNRGDSFTALGLDGHEQVGRAVAYVLVVLLGSMPWAMACDYER